MSSSRFAVAGLLVAIAALAGCSSEGASRGKDAVAVDESELTLAGMRYLGKIASGETKTSLYGNAPTYRSYAFDANAGDEITVDVTSPDGDAVAWITDANYNVLAVNDDIAFGSYDAKVTYKVPAEQPAQTYRIVFRDYALLEATFNVTLSIINTTVTACTYAGQDYQLATQFLASDGCNTCTCAPGGTVSCTELACACNPAAEPTRTYVGTPDQCVVIRYTCTDGQVPFSNSCGCGCETLPPSTPMLPPPAPGNSGS